MGRKSAKIGAALLLALPCVYAVVLLINYASIGFDVWRRESAEIRPIGDSRSVAEDGVVMAVRRERNIREKQFSLEWLVLIPATGEGYSCAWQEGFAGFEKGDIVTFVHTPVEMENPDAAAYLIGHNQGKQAKAARVEPVDLDGADANPVDP